jgi:hypothetical protein
VEIPAIASFRLFLSYTKAAGTPCLGLIALVSDQNDQLAAGFKGKGNSID